MWKIILGVLSGIFVVILFQTASIKNNQGVMYVERMKTAKNDFNLAAFNGEKINYPEAYSCRRSHLPKKEEISSSITAGTNMSRIGTRTFHLNNSKHYQLLCLFTLIKAKKRLRGISTANSIDISTAQSMDNININKNPRYKTMEHCQAVNRG